VLNGCRGALRRRARGGGQVWTPGDEALDRAAPGADADWPLLASGGRRAVLAALRRLAHRQREVLVLRYYLELSDAEIARTLGIGESTVRSTAHRGLAVLERTLTGETS
jgi:RNA polymerase sigma factor (sigma-70 family)